MKAIKSLVAPPLDSMPSLLTASTRAAMLGGVAMPPTVSRQWLEQLVLHALQASCDGVVEHRLPHLHDEAAEDRGVGVVLHEDRGAGCGPGLHGLLDLALLLRGEGCGGGHVAQDHALLGAVEDLVEFDHLGELVKSLVLEQYFDKIDDGTICTHLGADGLKGLNLLIRRDAWGLDEQLEVRRTLHHITQADHVTVDLVNLAARCHEQCGGIAPFERSVLVLGLWSHCC